MMRFPLRLTLDLTRVAIAQKLLGAARRPLVLRLDLARFSERTDSTSPSSDAAAAGSSRDLQALAMVRASDAPIVWIGGDTPLHYPRIGHLAREIIQVGRTVFIETDGRLLRRRIHEFRPESRLYLVLPIFGLQEAHDLRAAHPGSFRATIESVRAAKLSGFHICVETPIAADADGGELRGLAQFISTLGVDGWIQNKVFAAVSPSADTLAAARELIASGGWRRFSRHLSRDTESAEFAIRDGDAVASVAQTKPGSEINSELPVREESVRVL
jgi:hypothetical protein